MRIIETDKFKQIRQAADGHADDTDQFFGPPGGAPPQHDNSAPVAEPAPQESGNEEMSVDGPSDVFDEYNRLKLTKWDAYHIPSNTEDNAWVTDGEIDSVQSMVEMIEQYKEYILNNDIHGFKIEPSDENY